MTAQETTYIAGLRAGISQEMRRDPNVIVLGEDVAGGAGRGPDGGSADAWGGPFGKTKGLVKEFGESRVRDTPLSETGFLGMAIGGAAVGLRPVVDLMFCDFLGVCFDQVMNQAAKLRYMTSGAVCIPLVISTGSGAGVGAAAQHSGSLYALVTHIAGLKVVAPSNPADAKGLMAAAIRDDNPVVVFEHKRLFGTIGPVPDDEHVVPIGHASVVREGTDITIVGISATVKLACDAADQLQSNGISAEVIDPRSLAPIDTGTINESVAKTGRLVVVDEAGPRCGLAADIAASATTACFDSLRSAPRLVTAAHAPVPFSPILEQTVLPSVEQLVETTTRAVNESSQPRAGLLR